MGSHQVWTCRMNVMEDLVRFALEPATLVHHGGGYAGCTGRKTLSQQGKQLW